MNSQKLLVRFSWRWILSGVFLLLPIVFVTLYVNGRTYTEVMEVPASEETDVPELAIAPLIIEYSKASATKIKYSNAAAIAYAKKFAPKDTNSCGVFLYDPDPAKNRSDCAHFVAHCLSGGGITIKNQDPNLSLCPAGLSYRVVEIKAGLQELAKSFDNVKEISINDAIVGDYGFFKPGFLTNPSHAFMVCAPSIQKENYTVYAHTSRRNCEKTQPNWYQMFDVAFRMEDGP